VEGCPGLRETQGSETVLVSVCGEGRAAVAESEGGVVAPVRLEALRLPQGLRQGQSAGVPDTASGAALRHPGEGCKPLLSRKVGLVAAVDVAVGAEHDFVGSGHALFASPMISTVRRADLPPDTGVAWMTEVDLIRPKVPRTRLWP
jgi:hypothetical protein